MVRNVCSAQPSGLGNEATLRENKRFPDANARVPAERSFGTRVTGVTGP
jgi:hypothetical protein